MKKATSKPLQEMENESFANDLMVEPKPSKGSNTEKYQKVCRVQIIGMHDQR